MQLSMPRKTRDVRSPFRTLSGKTGKKIIKDQLNLDYIKIRRKKTIIVGSQRGEININISFISMLPREPEAPIQSRLEVNSSSLSSLFKPSTIWPYLTFFLLNQNYNCKFCYSSYSISEQGLDFRKDIVRRYLLSTKEWQFLVKL